MSLRPSLRVNSVAMFVLRRRLTCLSAPCVAVSACEVFTSIWQHPAHGPIKCGQCVECRLAYSREWAIRMTHEAQMHKVSCMVTLTYDDVHLPHHGQLLKSDLQKFFKRLRKNTGPFKYVACGEYGERTRRPHFHVALFGLDFWRDRIHHGYAKSGDKTYESKELRRSWSFGNHDIGTLNFESCAYIARYIMKKVKGIGASPLPLARLEDGELIMPNPEFLVMSKGIGAGWFDRFFMSDVFPHASVITSQGTPAPIPRYYKDRLVNKALQFELRARSEGRAQLSLDRTNFELSEHRKVARAGVSLSRANRYKREVDNG